MRPTLAEATPGDLAMALPSRIVLDLVEALDRLDTILPGVGAEGTLLYAPEIRYTDARYGVTPDLESSRPGFFVAGEGSGHARGVVYAAVTGVFAAHGVLRRLTGRVPEEPVSLVSTGPTGGR